MQTVLIGVGQAGGKLSTALARHDDAMGFRDAIAVNSANADLQDLPLDTVLIGQARVNGHGVGGDNELGAEIMQENALELLDEVSGRIDSATEAVFIVAGLGRGYRERRRARPREGAQTHLRHPNLRHRYPPGP